MLKRRRKSDVYVMLALFEWMVDERLEICRINWDWTFTDFLQAVKEKTEHRTAAYIIHIHVDSNTFWDM